MASRIEESFRDVLFTRMSPGAVTAMRSQGGSGAGLCTLLLPNLQGHEVGGAIVSCHLIAASPPTSSLDCVHLLVWPPT